MKALASFISDVHTADWRQAAACAEKPTKIFYPEQPGPAGSREGIRLCSRCPVRTECLLYCLRTQRGVDDYGIFGGTSRQERKDFLNGKPLGYRRAMSSSEAEAMIASIDRQRSEKRTRLSEKSD